MELIVPTVPSLLGTVGADVKVKIEEVSEASLKKLGAAWTAELVRKAAVMRKEKGAPQQGTQL